MFLGLQMLVDIHCIQEQHHIRSLGPALPQFALWIRACIIALEDQTRDRTILGRHPSK